MSDDEDNSSSSSSSYDSSGSSSPDHHRNKSKNKEFVDDSDSELDLKASSGGQVLQNRAKGKDGSGDENDSHSNTSSEEDNEDPGNKSPSSSSESSDHEDEDDDKENSQKEEEEGDDARSSIGSRSRSNSANGSHSKSDDSDSAHGSETDIKKLWERDPDFYGVRRSNRTRAPAHPPKLYPQIIQKSRLKKKVIKTSKKRKSFSDGESSDEENTRSTRKRNNMVSYKEQDSEDEADRMSVEEDAEEIEINGELEDEEQVDTIERIMDIREGKVGATGSATTLYVVAERLDPNETLPADTARETQFLIKWVGFSHLHNTWESLDTLQEKKAKGLKKLDNYCKREDELKRWKRSANPEDIEYYECQLELQQELVKSYTQAERIIAEHINSDGDTEYYVKWDCLSYAEATWENGNLISNRNPDVVKTYRKREASNKTPSSSNKLLRYRPKFSPLKEQPEYMRGDSKDLILRDYQLDGLNWLVHSWCKENSVILADEMGLGKTIQTICFLSYLFEVQNLYGPYLLVVPLSTMTAWQKEFGQWAPQINVVTYLGDVASRDIIREYEWYFKPNNKLKFNAILTTYEIVLKDKAFLSEISWAILLVDEAHRLKNGDSLLYKTLQEFNTNHRLLITGTPLQNSLKELWSLLHFIMPHKFDDWLTFEAEHEDAATKGYSKLHKQLEPFILRRVKKDVEKSLPAKVEQILRVEMTSIQKQYYKWILTKNYNALRKGVKGSVSSFVNVVMELKKCCNHAMLVKPIENSDTLTQLIKGSGKLMLLDKLLVRLKETGHRVLIFSQMVRMLDIIAEYLQQRRFAFQRLDGSIKGDLRKQALDHFNADGSQDFCFLLSTRAGGLGINLATADTVIIFDSDWNPQNDLQAQARAHRIGQKNQVNIYRLVTKSSVEEDIVERAKQKMVLDHLVIQRMDTTGRTVLDKGSKSGQPFNKDELNAILKFGAEELFKEDDNEGDDQCDIDEILRRAETHEDAGERPGDELLSAFKVASFSVNEDEEVAAAPQKDWDNIIPEDLRLKIEAEEKEKEMADLYLPPRLSRAANATDGNSNTTNNNNALRKIKRKRKHQEAQSEEESDDDRPRKRGRPKNAREGAKGFTDNQIRKFIKSFKRFPRPLSRIELIAKDCGMSDKAIPELKKLGEQLIQGCQAAMSDLKNPLNGPVHIKEEAPIEAGSMADGKKKREKGPMFKVAGINVNARTLSLALEELKPLGVLMPKDPEVRKAWKFELKAKVPPYDVEWGAEEDTRLLLGVWEFGTGSWDLIRNSDSLLKEKIFPETEKEKKPQLKHAQSRAEYLLKVMKKHLAITQAANPKRKVKSKVDSKIVPNALTEVENKRDKDEVLKPVKKERKKQKSKNENSSNHLASELGDDLPGINPKIFSQCKEMMRPVKNALKSLDNPDSSLSEKDQVKHTKNCLLQIGDQIQKCLQKYQSDNEHKEWKSNLWIFVSHFTEYDAGKLYKLYRKASKKIDDRDNTSKKLEKSEKPKESSKHHHSHKDKKERHRDRTIEPSRNFQENSGVGNTTSSSRSSQPKLSTYERDRKRERFAQQMGELPPEPRVPQHPPIDDPHYNNSNSSISPRKFHHPYSNNGSSYNRGTNGGDYYNSNHYRNSPGDRPRERAPGDPRDRTGVHSSKGYRNDRDGYERDRSVLPGDRRPYSAQPQRSRWGPEAYNSGMPRRGGNYYGANATSPITPPGHLGSFTNQIPYGTGPGALPHHSGRIAPPLGSNDWRRGDGVADADMGINQRSINEDSQNDSMEPVIDLGRRRRELY